MSSALLLSKCCCDDPSPCTSPFVKCSYCDWTGIPKWLIQCTLPGITKTNWTLTRTGAYTWEYLDNQAYFVLGINSAECTIQCWFGGNYVSRTMGVYMTMAGTLVSTGVTPPISIPFRCCALGPAVPKEIITTISGVEICALTGNNVGCTYPSAFRCDIALSGGPINGTFAVPAVGYSRATGCAWYEAEIAKLRFTLGSNSIEYPIYMSYRSFIWDVAIFCYVEEQYPEWFLNPPGGWRPTHTYFPMYVVWESTCNNTMTWQNLSMDPEQCKYGAVTGYNGYVTATPIHDDNWTPPPDIWR